MQRVEFDTDLDLDADFTVAINPLSFDGIYPSRDFEHAEALDGEAIVTLPLFDNRIKSMIWRNIPNKSPYAEMVSGLKNLMYLVSGVNLNLRDLHPVGGNSSWIPIRVVDVKTAWRDGAGPNSATNKLEYALIQLDFTLRYNV